MIYWIIYIIWLQEELCISIVDILICLSLWKSRRLVSDVSSSEDASQDEIFSKAPWHQSTLRSSDAACQSFTPVASSRLSGATDRYMQIESSFQPMWATITRLRFQVKILIIKLSRFPRSCCPLRDNLLVFWNTRKSRLVCT